MKKQEYTLSLPERQVQLETLYFMYEKLIWDTANQSIKVKEIKSNILLKPTKQNKSITFLENQERINIKMILIIEENITNNHISQKLIKLNSKLSEKYRINIDLDHLHELKREIYLNISKIRKQLEDTKNQLTKEFIKNRVEDI